jgi:hypothetical protein
MKCPSRGCLVFLLAGVLGSTAGTAWADDAAPSGGAAPMAAPRKFTGDQQAFFISGGVADSTTWSIGTTLPVGVTISVGVNLNYDGNGLAVPGSMMRSSDKFAFSGVLYGAYYIYNKFPVGIAIEAAVVEPLSPEVGSPVTVIQPGIGILYAPFPAPIVIGSGLDLQIVIPKADGAKPIVQTVTPGLRIVYVF